MTRPPSGDVRGHGETVLVAEDDDAVRAVVCGTLKRNGYAVLEARNGIEAVAMVHKHAGAIRCLLTDMVMPGLSGPDVAAAAREGQPGVRVLFMSGYADRDLILQGRMTAHDAYLAKPFASETLLAKLRAILSDVERVGYG